MLLPNVTSVGNVVEIPRKNNSSYTRSSQLKCTQEKWRPIGKKAKRVRTAFTTSQLLALEACYKKNKYLAREERGKMALRYGIAEKPIKIWFQNRRMKEKNSSGSKANSKISLDQSSESKSPFTYSSGLSDLSELDGILRAENSFPESLENPSANMCTHMYTNSEYLQFPQFSNTQNYNSAQFFEPVKSAIFENSGDGHLSTSNINSASGTYAEGYYYQPASAMPAPYDNMPSYREMQYSPDVYNYQYTGCVPPTYDDYNYTY